MPYAKLHSSIITSSIWTEPDPTRILFITLLALSDWNGNVFGSKKGISQVANINPDAADKAWTCLLSPDPDSSDLLRSPEHEGRRVEQIEQGFRIINYEYYRSIGSSEDRKVQNREAKRRERSCQHVSAHVSTGQQPDAMSAHTDTDTDTDHCTIPNGIVLSGSRKKKDYHPDSIEVLRYLNLRSGRNFRKTETSLRPISSRLSEDGVDRPGVFKMIDRQTTKWKGTNMEDYLRPETLFGKQKFEGYYASKDQQVLLNNTPVGSKDISQAQLTIHSKELDRLEHNIKHLKETVSRDPFGMLTDPSEVSKLKEMTTRRMELRKILGVTV